LFQKIINEEFRSLSGVKVFKRPPVETGGISPPPAL
jgi:hypothetical protein